MTGHNAARRHLDAAHQGAGYAPIRHAALDPTGRPVRSTAESDDAFATYHPVYAQRAEGTVWAHEPGGIVYPHPDSAAERTGNVYEAKIASNVQRRGTVQAAEGLAQRDGRGVEQMFASGFADDRSASAPYYPAKIANGRSGLADGHDSGNPAWADDPAALAYFSQGTATMRANGNIPPLSARSSVSQVGTDLSRLDLSERGRVMYGKTYGSNDKLIRYNEAEVRD